MSELQLQSNQAQARARAVAEIYRAQRQPLYGRCLRIVRDPSLAEDALQQAFVRLLRYWDSYLQAPSKRFWLLRACDQVCFNLLQQRARISQTEGAGDGCDVEQVGAHAGAGPEQWELLERILGGLDEVQRYLLVCAFLNGMSKTEIARDTGWSRQTIHRKLRSIRLAALRLDHARSAARAA